MLLPIPIVIPIDLPFAVFLSRKILIFIDKIFPEGRNNFMPMYDLHGVSHDLWMSEDEV